MPTVSPVRFAEIRPFADMAAVVSGGVRAIVTLEHSDRRTPLSPTEPAHEAALLRIWTAPGDTGALRETARWTASLPVASEVAMTVQDGHLLALAQVNQVRAAYVLSTPWPAVPQAASATPPLAASTVPITVLAPVGLDPALAALVRINPRDDWSTFGLAPRAWLFHPSLIGGPEPGALTLASNTADGKAVIWQGAAGGSAPPRVVAVAPAALDPVLLQVEGHDCLFYRAMPAGWSVFFHDLRYSSQFGPVALPLMMARLDAAGAVATTTDVSAAAGIGPVFAFAVRVAAAGLVWTVVGEAARQPELRVFATGPAGAAPQTHYLGLLRAVPLRLTMSESGGVALVGLAYSNSGSYALDALSVPVR